MNDRLKYIGYDIVFQEVPDEVSLAINVSGCPHMCEGCHSTYLWEYKGNYISEDLPVLIDKYKGLITCVCFMGGDQNQTELFRLASYVKQNNMKTALYSGLDDVCLFGEGIKFFDYIKTGHYDQKRGGLDSKSTNQKMYSTNPEIKDITYKFWNRSYK